MLLVQPYGADLYVGWTMWRSRSTATLLAHFLRDTFGRFAPLPVFSSELRAASTRAMRESVHSLAREGVAAAAHVDEAARATRSRPPRPRPGTTTVSPRRSNTTRAGTTRGATARAGTTRATTGRERPSAGTSAGAGALPRAVPTADPTAGWATEDRPRERVTRPEGWGPPPRD